MATRWEVTRAVRQSPTVEPLARLVMLILAELADNDTGVVPEEFGPSLSELSAQTGMSRSTVARWLDLLERHGWVKRKRPTVEAARAEGARTQYTLMIGSSPSNGLDEDKVKRTKKTPSASPSNGPAVVRETDGGSPADGLNKSPSRTTTNSLTSSSSASRRPEPVERPDVEALCRRLADAIEANGFRPPNITKKWRDAARLLMDRDNISYERICRAIDWSQNNEFWRTNILSMPTLREKYDRLQGQATLERQKLAEQRGRGQLQERNGVLLNERNAASMTLIEQYAAAEAAEAAAQPTLAIEGARA